MHCIFCVMLSQSQSTVANSRAVLKLFWRSTWCCWDGPLARDSVLVLSSRCCPRFDSLSMSQTDGAQDAAATPPRSVRVWDVMAWSPDWSAMSPPAPRPKRRRVTRPQQPAASPPGKPGALKPDWSAMSPGDFLHQAQALQWRALQASFRVSRRSRHHRGMGRSSPSHRRGMGRSSRSRYRGM